MCINSKKKKLKKKYSYVFDVADVFCLFLNIEVYT